MKECEVRIEIPVKDVDKIFKVEKLLREIGVDFDTGYSFPDQRRDWQFDWSLKGAKVIFKRFKNGKEAEK